VGTVTLKRGKHGELLRETITLERVKAREADNFTIQTFERKETRPQSAAPMTTRTTPLVCGEANVVMDDTFANTTLMDKLELAKSRDDGVVEHQLIEEEPVAKYWKRVDRICIPSNFIKLKGCEGLSKTEVQEMYPGRNIFQATVTDRDSTTGKLVSDDGEFYAETYTVEERQRKRIER